MILVGDANVADKAVQTYLAGKAHRSVLVHCMERHGRNNVGLWHCHIVTIRGNSYRMRHHTDLWHALHTPDQEPPSNRRHGRRQEAATN